MIRNLHAKEAQSVHTYIHADLCKAKGYMMAVTVSQKPKRVVPLQSIADRVGSVNKVHSPGNEAS